MIAPEPFDRGLASSPCRRVKLEEVTDLLPLTHAPETIETYRAAMSAGDAFPPVSVVRLGRRLLVADGHKRLSAFRSLGQDEVLVEVWPFRRLLLDQLRQVRDNARKNGRVLRALFSDPREGRRLLLATFGHWRRVARNLAHGLVSAFGRAS